MNWQKHLTDHVVRHVNLGQVWYLIMLIPDLCTLKYMDHFEKNKNKKRSNFSHEMCYLIGIQSILFVIWLSCIYYKLLSIILICEKKYCTAFIETRSHETDFLAIILIYYYLDPKGNNSL